MGDNLFKEKSKPKNPNEMNRNFQKSISEPF